MKQSILAITLVTVFSLLQTQSAQATVRDSASQCGLTDQYGDDEWVEISSIDLTRASDRTIKALPTITKQQIIIATRDLAQDYVEHTEPITDTVEAVKVLRMNSDSETVYVVNVEVKGRPFTYVLHYPGDNPYGIVFKGGTRTIVASINDGDVNCVK